MKRLALAFIAASALVFGFGTMVSAQTYSTSITVDPTAAGAPYQAALVNCTVGEAITFAQAESTPPIVTVTCAAVSSAAGITGSVLGLMMPQQVVRGRAPASFTAAPRAPGTYTITATGPISGTRSATFTIPAQVDTTVPATTVAPVAATPSGGLPATGSDGISPTTGIAIGLLVVGLGLFVVSQVRRRQPNPA